jgi:hypothetical protein
MLNRWLVIPLEFLIQKIGWPLHHEPHHLPHTETNFTTPSCYISNKTHHNHLPIVCSCGILVINIITLNILIPDDWLDYAFPAHNLNIQWRKVSQWKLCCIIVSHATVNWIMWSGNWIFFSAFSWDSFVIFTSYTSYGRLKKLVSCTIQLLYDPYHR